MKIDDILKACDGKLLNYSGNGNYNNIKIDSRKITNGDIFIAIKGNNKDGHNYIHEAILNGAVIIISSTKFDNIPLILVEDTIKAMGLIASYMLNKYKPKVIAITGSVGKTTTKNLLYTFLNTKYNILTNEKNYNNHIGVPLTIFNLNSSVNMVILEFGMNHLGEISYLSKMIHPNIAIITNIGTSHIGILKSKENILKAKLEILDGMDKNILYVNGDDDYLKHIDAIKCGFNENNSFRGFNLKGDLFSSSFDISWKEKIYKISAPLSKHLTNNILNSIKVALDLEIPIWEITKSLYNYKNVPNRMEFFDDNNGNTIISDCYNSSYESLIGVLSLLKNYNSNKLLIIGDINEIGDMEKEIYRKIENAIKKIKNKKIILIGNRIIKIKVDSLKFKNYFETINYLKSTNIVNTLILIKASRSLKLEKITDYFKNT